MGARHISIYSMVGDTQSVTTYVRWSCTPEGIEGYLIPVVRIHDTHERVGRVSDAGLFGVQQRHQAYHVLPVAELFPGSHDVEGEPNQRVVKESTWVIVVVVVIVLVVAFAFYAFRSLPPSIPQQCALPWVQASSSRLEVEENDYKNIDKSCMEF